MGKPHVKGAGDRLNNKLTSRDINAQCNEIAQRWSRGQTEWDIRREMGLSGSQYDHRMKKMRGASLDAVWIWTRFQQSTRAQIERLYMIYRLAVGPQPTENEQYGDVRRNLTEARHALMAMAKLERERIEVGQSLGVYDRAPEHVELSWDDPTMGLFLDAAEKVGEFAEEPDPAAVTVDDDGNGKIVIH